MILKQISVITHLEDDQEKLNKSFAFFPYKTGDTETEASVY